MPDSPLDPNVLAVCRKMQDRAAVGFAKYGVTTERPDLDTVAWLTHLQEELMDAAVYAQVLLGRLAAMPDEIAGAGCVGQPEHDSDSSNPGSSETVTPRQPDESTIDGWQQAIRIYTGWAG